MGDFVNAVLVISLWSKANIFHMPEKRCTLEMPTVSNNTVRICSGNACESVINSFLLWSSESPNLYLHPPAVKIFFWQEAV